MLTLRKYQEDSIKSVYAHWSHGGMGALLCLPCGAGKSIVLAEIMRDALTSWPDTRVCCITHVRELVAQNLAELLGIWPEAPAGVYSAGLKRRDKVEPILFATVQSIVGVIHNLEPFDIAIIDEAHRIGFGEATQYRKVLDFMRLQNPKLRILGLTATPYRTDSGMLTEGESALFDKITHEVGIQELVDAGHLVDMVAKGGRAKADMTGVHHRAGDFVASEMERAFDKLDLVERACDEIVAAGAERRAILIFAAGISHAEHVRDTLRARGVESELVTGSTPMVERDAIFARFKAGQLRSLVNVGVCTTGVNFTITDLIVLLRATESTSLFVQCVGRGLRNHPGKERCYLLDFGDNVVRLGPLDKPQVKRKQGDGTGAAPCKECPVCCSIVHASAIECPDCGHTFPPREVNHSAVPYEGAVMAAQQKPEWVEVTDVQYRRHQKAGKPDSVAVTYHCGPLTSATEWWCPEHGGYATSKTWACLQRAGMRAPRPETTSELLARLDELREPAEIMITKEGKYTRVARVRYE